MTKNNKTFVYSFLLVSVLLWAAVSDAWGYSKHLLTNLPNDWNRYIYGYISRLIWAIPFLFLIVKEKHRETIQPEQIFRFHFHWNSFLTVFVFSTTFVLGKMFFNHGGWWINPNIIFLQELSKYLIVGFVEELVYRGFGLNMLSNFSSGRTAIVVSSLFFAALHIPAYFIHWYCDGVFLLTPLISQVITVFIFGLIFGVVFQKSKSIWPVAIIHFWYDFTHVLFIG